MKWFRRTLAALAALVVVLVVAAFAVGFPPSWGAGAILHPAAALSGHRRRWRSRTW